MNPLASRHARHTAAIALSATLLLSVRAHAQQKEAVAETLFQEGKKLMSEGSWAEACPKLAESNRLDPGAGALTALALCHKAEGKNASAWAEFKDVVSFARRDGRKDREQVALESIAELEPKLNRIRIDVSEAALAQKVEVRVDETVVTPAAYGQAIPVDPGAHRVEARAVAKLPFSTVVTLTAERELKVVAIPPLADDARKEATPAPAPIAALAAPVATVSNRPGDPNQTRRIAGYATVGVGIAAFVVGSVFGINAISKSNDSDGLCGDPCDSAAGLQANRDARSAANVANIAIGGGLVAIAAGVVLILTSPNTNANVRTAKGARAASWLTGSF